MLRLFYTLFRVLIKQHLKIEGTQTRRCSTSVSTICVALLFPVILGMSRNYLNSVHLIAFK